VRVATQEYRAGEDTLAQFIAEKCIVKEDAQAKAGELYAAYAAWSKDYNMTAMSGTAFGKRMGKRFEKERTNAGQIYVGIGLLTGV
jgi:putative DNA primase/helicase